VKICNELVKEVKKYVFQTGPRVVRSNFCKGPVYPGKGPKKSQKAKRKFWGQQVVFGAKYLKFGPKRANLATLPGCPPSQPHTFSPRVLFDETFVQPFFYLWTAPS